MINPDRLDRLHKLGLVYNGNEFIHKDINFHWVELECMTDEEFEKAFKGACKRMKVLKQIKFKTGKKVKKTIEISSILHMELKTATDGQSQVVKMVKTMEFFQKLGVPVIFGDPQGSHEKYKYRWYYRDYNKSWVIEWEDDSDKEQEVLNVLEKKQQVLEQ